MVPIIDLSIHSGFCNGQENQLRNGEIGVGRDSKGSAFLVVSCSNCGDYSWISRTGLEEALKAIKKLERSVK